MIVAAYCRVSTDREDQRNSFQTQCTFFQEYISRIPDWTLYRIYADEGITGTSTKKRIQFNRMIADAHAGKYQLILTKEVSRFSRNLLDTIVYTRELRAMGIGVRFLTDGIDTMDPDAELRLSIMATIAQEESRRVSARVVWGQTRQMERGVVFGPSLLGYDVKDGALILNPSGAELVLKIYHKYVLEGWGTSRIANHLNKSGIPTQRGGVRWTPQAIVKILKNEKYAGDLVQKKTCTPDYLSHEKKRNTGQFPFVRIENHHTPIIDREIWNEAQRILQKRNTHRGKTTGHSDRHSFSGKIYCGNCGSTFVARFRYLRNGEKIRQWSCGKSVRQGSEGCNVGRILRDDDAIQMLLQAMNALNLEWDAIFEKTLSIIPNDTAREIMQMQISIQSLERKLQQLIDQCLSGKFPEENTQALRVQYENQIRALQENKAELEKVTMNCHDLRSIMKEIISGNRFSKAFYQGMLDQVTVFDDRHMELRLKGLPMIFHFQDSDG